MKTHLYLRASTNDQDAMRARASLEVFAAEKGMTIVDVYSENITGTQLDRPELNRLLESASVGEIILCESVDRLSRMTSADWEQLKYTIRQKGLRLVVADLPTTHVLIQDAGISGQVMGVVNGMLLDLMATMAYLDQQKRVERIREGLANKRVADPLWKPTGKRRNENTWKRVEDLMLKHPTMSAADIAKLADVGTATVYRIKKASRPVVG
ncbi:resolvase [Pseudomonas sp. v388]|uniref:recombinase family protein n=1 Tax=Pseudomonas sp. v388 TaxID=2479849 RepID=UPI000F768883|nr:recombinase family protein [Pseudomonas sp. v388]RRV08047.1 resolvase [Pseudomonas sp. v388]